MVVRRSHREPQAARQDAADACPPGEGGSALNVVKALPASTSPPRTRSRQRRPTSINRSDDPGQPAAWLGTHDRDHPPLGRRRGRARVDLGPVGAALHDDEARQAHRDRCVERARSWSGRRRCCARLRRPPKNAHGRPRMLFVHMSEVHVHERVGRPALDAHLAVEPVDWPLPPSAARRVWPRPRCGRRRSATGCRASRGR